MTEDVHMKKNIKESIERFNSAMSIALSFDVAGDFIDFKVIDAYVADSSAAIHTYVEDSSRGVKQHVICMEHYNVFIYARDKKDAIAKVYVEPLFDGAPADISMTMWLAQNQVAALVRLLSISKEE